MRTEEPATVAVTGAAGMLGQDVVRGAPSWASVVPLTRADCDLCDAEDARRCLTKLAPTVIVHCAAFTDVDGATRDPEAAWQGNAVVTQSIAAVAAELGARLLYVSTDYVFSGEAAEPYVESATPSPLNAYGASKLAGEHAAAMAPNALIVRTQWLFGIGGRNFVRAIIEAASANKRLRVVRDEFGCPTYTADLARALWRVIETEAAGIIHLTNTGACSRLQLAAAALELAELPDADLAGISADEWASPTRRPRNAVLASERLEGLGLEPLRPWREALRDYVSCLLA